MTDIRIEYVDQTYARLRCERSIIKELQTHFTFYVPGYKFMPTYKNKMWDGTLVLLHQDGKIYRGLINEVIEVAEFNGYTTEVPEDEVRELTIPDDFYDVLDAKYEAKDYQDIAFRKCIGAKRQIVLSPTGSGKSFIIYLIASLMQRESLRTLIIVPTVNLTTQMAKDFIDYNRGNPVDVHSISAGIDKHVNASIVVTTWQSAVDLPKSWYDEFDCIIGDECHLFKAKSLIKIMEKASSIPYRFGFTGTLDDDSQVNELTLKGLFGEVIKTKSTAALIESGDLAKVTINSLVLNYSDEERKLAAKFTYQDEIDFIVGNERRRNFVTRLAMALKGNSLIMFRFKEKHGKVLYEAIKRATNQPVYYVDGDVAAKDRETIRQIVLKEKQSIIVCSFQTFGTGLNIPNIDNIVLSHPLKTKITLLQSIGRGLRKPNGKEICNVYDVCDDLMHKKHMNYALVHFRKRLKRYYEEEFEVTFHKYDL